MAVTSPARSFSGAVRAPDVTDSTIGAPISIAGLLEHQPVRVPERQHEQVGQVEVVVDVGAHQQRRPCRPAAGCRPTSTVRVLVCGLDHQPAYRRTSVSAGTDSTVPSGTRSGSSMSLASARARHRPASSYSAKAMEASVSPAPTRRVRVAVRRPRGRVLALGLGGDLLQRHGAHRPDRRPVGPEHRELGADRLHHRHDRHLGAPAEDDPRRRGLLRRPGLLRRLQAGEERLDVFDHVARRRVGLVEEHLQVERAGFGAHELRHRRSSIPWPPCAPTWSSS